MSHYDFRLSRLQYLLYTICVFAFLLVLLLAVGDSSDKAIVYVVGSIATMVLWVGRMHDMGHSGWWTLVGFIPIIGGIFCIYLFFAPGRA